jgi:hypothetical protein
MGLVRWEGLGLPPRSGAAIRAPWEKRRLRLKKDHQWKAAPGSKIFVADRGAVRFDIPDTWVVVPAANATIKFHDRPPPRDNCTLQLSVFHLPPRDWNDLPLSMMIEQIVDYEQEGLIERGQVVEILRHDLDIAWIETRYIDPSEHREARSRICLARGSNIQPLMTLAYWADDASWVVPIFDEMLRTLRLGEYINDPTRGDLR